MIPAFSTSCGELIKRWEEFTRPQGSCELDVWPEIQTLTVDAISRTAFSSSYEEGQRIFELQKEQIALMMEAAYSLYVPGFRCIASPLFLFLFLFLILISSDFVVEEKTMKQRSDWSSHLSVLYAVFVY